MRGRVARPHSGASRSARRRVAAVSTTSLLALAAWGGLAVSASAPASASTTVTVPGDLAVAPGGAAETAVPLPVGVRPVALTGRVAQPRPVPVEVLVGGRVVGTVPAGAARFRLPLRAGDLAADGVLRVRARSGGDACDDTESVTLGSLRVLVDGEEQQPTGLADFLGDAVTRVDVVVDRRAGTDVLDAALAAVAALAARYPSTVDVVLSTGADAPGADGTPGHRVVRLERGVAGVEVGTEASTPVLTLTGGAEDLRGAATALGSDLGALAGDGDLGRLVLERTAARSPLGTTLADLGTESLRLTTGATAYVGIRQDTFGTPLSALDLHLVGTHSAVPEDGPETRLDAYLNGALVDSVTLGEEPELELDLHVEGASLAAENGLELVLRSAGGCDAMPAEVSIDGAASTVQATAGSSGARGLQRFPQVLGGDLPVAVGSEAGLESAAVVDAAALVVALQRAAARPIDVRLVPVADLLDGGRAGLLVAAGGAETRRLGASLQLEQVRVLADGAERLEVDSDQPYAALQAVTDGGREVLVLGGWSPPDEAGRSLELTARTARWVAARGWGAVGADYVVTDAAGEVSLVRSETVVPQDGVVEERGDAAWWLVGGVGALLVALVAGAVVHGRRQGAVRELVRAQNDEDAHRDRP